MSIYFSYPLSTNNRKKNSVLRALARQFGGIVEPLEIEVDSCEECLRKLGETSFRDIDRCEGLVSWPILDTCRLDCEFYYAALAGKKLYIVELAFDWEDIEVEPVSIKEHYTLRRFS